MSNSDVDNLVNIYFDSRPNKDRQHDKLAVLFLACSGAGKSTIRERLVEELGATYVCNDEVRYILDEYNLPISLLKPIVDKTWQKLTKDSGNNFIVFDSNLSSYYMHSDSYYHSVKRLGFRIYIISLDLAEDELVKRVNRRPRKDRAQILDQLPDQIIAQRNATKNLHPNYRIRADSNYTDLVEALRKQTVVD